MQRLDALLNSAKNKGQGGCIKIGAREIEFINNNKTEDCLRLTKENNVQKMVQSP